MRLIRTAKIQHKIVIKCLIKTFYEVTLFGTSASIQKLVTGSEIVDNENTPTPPNPDGGGDGGDEEAPDPTV